MKKLKKAIIIGSFLLVTSCGTNKYKVEDEINISGTVSNDKTMVDGEYVTKSMLNLDKPIIIDGKSIKKIEIDYEQDLKDNSKVTINGKISNSDTTSYGINVDDVKEESSIVNTFSNEYFSITIPSSIIKLCNIKRVDEGFIVYSKSNMDTGGEVFSIIKVNNKEFKELQNNESSYIEKIKSNQNYTIIIKYPVTTEYSDENFDEYETIINQIETIKNNVTIK